MKILNLAAAGAVIALSTASAFAEVPIKEGDSSLGKVLTNDQGMTLYTFDKDMADQSMCSGDCAMNWPPLTAAADATGEGDYTLITREDGTKQWAYDGKPLYLWSKDTAPGEVTGDGVNDVWHAAMAAE